MLSVRSELISPSSPTDMKKQHVFDPLISKRQQYLLATQLVRAVLKVIGTSLLNARSADWTCADRRCDNSSVWRRLLEARLDIESNTADDQTL